MQYDIDRFYEISAFFNDDLGVMANVIAIRQKADAKKIYKDLLFGRYKTDFIKTLQNVKSELLQSPMKPYAEAIKTIMGGDEIFSRDDMTNAEKYSVFERQYKVHKKTKCNYGLFEGLI